MLLLSILFPTQELKELCYFVFTQGQKIVMVMKLFFFIPNINIFDVFLGNTMSGECVSGPSTESHVPTKKHPSPS